MVKRVARATLIRTADLRVSGLIILSCGFAVPQLLFVSQVFQDFQAISSAVQSGNMTTAQTALSSFLQDLQNGPQNNPLSQLFSNNSALGKDLQNLQTALQSNDSSSAQNAFRTLIQDMQKAMKTQGMHHRHHHFHHRVDNDGDHDDQGGGSASSSSGSVTDSITVSITVGSTLNVQA